MTSPIEMLLWAPNRETFANTMAGLTLPGGRHIAWLATAEAPGAVLETSSIRTLDVIACDEIGPIIKKSGNGDALEDPTAENPVVPLFDANGQETGLLTFIPGYHVNMVATGWLAATLTAGMPAEGDIFTRTRILELLGTMNWQPSEVGEPAGYVGTSGVKIFDPNIINQRARRWALEMS